MNRNTRTSRKYKYEVTFEDTRNEPVKGTTDAPDYEHAVVKIEQFWGRQGTIENVKVEEA